MKQIQFTNRELTLTRDAIGILIDQICAGDCPDYEPDLDELIDLQYKLSKVII